MTPEQAERDWEEFADYVTIRTTDLNVANEVAGKRPPGGVDSWNTHWLLRIKYMSKNLEENQKYIDYIIKRRQEASLPPLEGYPLEEGADAEGGKPEKP